MHVALTSGYYGPFLYLYMSDVVTVLSIYSNFSLDYIIVICNILF